MCAHMQQAQDNTQVTSSFVREKEKRKKVGNRKISVDGKLHEGNLSAK